MNPELLVSERLFFVACHTLSFLVFPACLSAHQTVQWSMFVHFHVEQLAVELRADLWAGKKECFQLEPERLCYKHPEKTPSVRLVFFGGCDSFCNRGKRPQASGNRRHHCVCDNQMPSWVKGAAAACFVSPRTTCWIGVGFCWAHCADGSHDRSVFTRWQETSSCSSLPSSHLPRSRHAQTEKGRALRFQTSSVLWHSSE